MNTPGTLAHHVDFRRLATQQREIDGELYLSQLPRMIAEMAAGADASGAVRVHLRFSEDGQRRVNVAGSIETTLTLTCQRCLEAFDKHMSVAVAGVVVGDDDAAANVPRADEPILAEGDTLDLHTMVSDELLLALPPVARCGRPDCVSNYEHVAGTPEPAIDDKHNNPFAVLGQLKRGD
ncbi:YceD family protein [Salinisphaera aquimarina]|uniref:Large ribosomal RNA subunit accumulation protein YceD n=1 Tax=Salinisphaera aquimarina TaxID=2094031 RepID=A0ABV7ENZ8_9GAMM